MAERLIRTRAARRGRIVRRVDCSVRVWRGYTHSARLDCSLFGYSVIMSAAAAPCFDILVTDTIKLCLEYYATPLAALCLIGSLLSMPIYHL